MASNRTICMKRLAVFAVLAAVLAFFGLASNAAAQEHGWARDAEHDGMEKFFMFLHFCLCLENKSGTSMSRVALWHESVLVLAILSGIVWQRGSVVGLLKSEIAHGKNDGD